MPTAQTIPTYEALAHDIRRMGIDAVFGLMSDDTALFVSTLDGMGVRFHSARHENNAVSMAEGYAAASGRVGIVINGRGPATANSIHGAVYAARSSSGVLMIFGEASTAAGLPNGLGPDGKGFNAAGVLQAAGIRTFLANDPLAARRTLAQAMAAARGGAVALLLPTNVQFARIEFDPDAAPPLAAAAAPKPARQASIRAAASVLRDSRRPLVVAGLGAYRAGARDALIRLADRIGAGLATTLKAKDMFSGHPFDAGIIGSFSHAAGRRLIEQADAIVVFGAGLNQRTTSYGTAISPDVPLIQVDSSRGSVGRWFHADVAVIGDARAVAEQLADALAERGAADKPLHGDELRRTLAGYDLASEFQPQSTPRTLDPRVVALELDRLLPKERNAVYDTGNFFQIVPYFSVPGPSHFKTAADFSSIGMGFGTAIGFACGAPHRPTVFFVGDGGLLMQLGELETVARMDLPLVIVVMNDAAYGAELHYLKMRDAPVAMSVFPEVDYAPVAEAFGFRAATVRTVEGLRALAPLLANPDGPILLDCKINAAVAAPFLLETVEHERRKS